jgi:crossover junction endodeoxyribonuclease RuvC
MTKYWLGIDPGLQGAVAILDDAGALVVLHDVPTLTVPTSRGTRHEYDLPGMAALLAPYGQSAHVLIEEAQAMPRQGVRSMFTVGLGFGAWLGILGALGLAHTRNPSCRVEAPPGPSWRERSGTPTSHPTVPGC